MNSSVPVWQFAETNQGLLSVAALVLALFFWLHEYRTNLRSGVVRRREYIDVVIGVIDEILEFTTAIRIAAQGGRGYAETFDAWHGKIIAPRFTIDALRAMPPNDHLVAIEVHRLWTALQMRMDISFSASPAAPFIAMEATLQASKEALQKRR